MCVLVGALFRLVLFALCGGTYPVEGGLRDRSPWRWAVSCYRRCAIEFRASCSIAAVGRRALFPCPDRPQSASRCPRDSLATRVVVHSRSRCTCRCAASLCAELVVRGGCDWYCSSMTLRNLPRTPLTWCWLSSKCKRRSTGACRRALLRGGGVD